MLGVHYGEIIQSTAHSHSRNEAMIPHPRTRIKHLLLVHKVARDVSVDSLQSCQEPPQSSPRGIWDVNDRITPRNLRFEVRPSIQACHSSTSTVTSIRGRHSVSRAHVVHVSLSLTVCGT